MKARGVILAVSSKNNDADAREVFERHEGMRIRLDANAITTEMRPWSIKRSRSRNVRWTQDGSAANASSVPAE